MRCNEDEKKENTWGFHGEFVLPLEDHTNSQLSYVLNLHTVMILDESFLAFKIDSSQELNRGYLLCVFNGYFAVFHLEK